MNPRLFHLDVMTFPNLGCPTAEESQEVETNRRNHNDKSGNVRLTNIIALPLYLEQSIILLRTLSLGLQTWSNRSLKILPYFLSVCSPKVVCRIGCTVGLAASLATRMQRMNSPFATKRFLCNISYWADGAVVRCVERWS